MTPCPLCGAATPAQERILPLAVQFYPPSAPKLAMFLCHGEARVDAELLQFGIIVRTPWTCRNTRWIAWEKMTPELRGRAVLAEQLRLALGCLI